MSAPAPGFSLFKEGLQAYFVQQLRGSDGVPLSGVHLLYLATAAGAAALELDDQIGDLSPGKRFDAMWLQPDDGGDASTGSSRTPTEPMTPWPRSSRWRHRPTSRASGSMASRSDPAGAQVRSAQHDPCRFPVCGRVLP